MNAKGTAVKAALSIAASLAMTAGALSSTAHAEETPAFFGEPAMSCYIPEKSLDDIFIRSRVICYKVNGPGHLESVSNCQVRDNGTILVDDLSKPITVKLVGEAQETSFTARVNGNAMEANSGLLVVDKAGTSKLDISFIDLIAEAKIKEAEEKAERERQAVEEAARQASQSAAPVKQEETKRVDVTPEVRTTRDGAHRSCLEICGEVVPFIETRSSKLAPDNTAALWQGGNSTNDGEGTYFIGHNPGVFHNLIDRKVGMGDKIGFWDADGNYRMYTVDDILEIRIGGSFNSIRKRAMSGESIALQTCLNYDNLTRVFIAH